MNSIHDIWKTKRYLLLCLVAVIIGGLLLIQQSASPVHAQSAQDGYDPDADGIVYAFITQSDGMTWIGGAFNNISGEPRTRLARLYADGSLDADFNPGGNGAVRAFAMQPDGKLVVVGSFLNLGGPSRNRIARLNPDGSLDTEFTAGTGGDLRAVAIQEDGKILVGGFFEFVSGQVRDNIARFHPDGSLDMDFVPLTNGFVNALAVQPDGKILVAGDFTTIAGHGRNRIARLNPDGTIDDTFDPGLGANGEIRTMAIQADGKILIGGNFDSLGGQIRQRIARLNTDGSVDLDFNPSIPSGFVNALTVQADGKILFGGLFTMVNSTPRGNVARLLPNGSIDVDFNPGANNQVYSVYQQPDGKLLVGGAFTFFGGQTRNHIARIYPSGGLETNFVQNTNGEVQTLALQPDGSILVGGSFSVIGGNTRNRFAQLNPDGSIGYYKPSVDNSVFAIAVQTDGKILLGGSFSMVDGEPRSRIARLNSDGSLDEGFNLSASGGVVSSLVVQPDGKILVGGGFTTLGGQSRNSIARLNADGTLDNDFDPNANGVISSIAVQDDGKILVGGAFTSIDGQPRNKIARLHPNGSIDTGFNIGSNNPIQILTILAQPDGKILVGGLFTNFGGQNNIVRLNADGSLDASFNLSADNRVSTLVRQTNGKTLVGGGFTMLGGQSRNSIARLNADGTLDMAFNPGAEGGNINNTVNAMVVQTGGKIVVGGFFSTLAGEPRDFLGRLSEETPAVQNLSADDTGTTIQWMRSGTGPEVRQVIFETSLDGVNYGPGAAATRIPGGWELDGLSLPTFQTFYIRARGFYNTRSSSIVESVQIVYLGSPPAAFGKSTPANDATNISLDPTLTWAASPGADSYEYCLGTTDGACDLVDWTDVGANTSVAESGLDTATTYFWQVRAVNPGGSTEANEGAFWSFITVPEPPAAFGKSTPADGATNLSLDPTLTWAGSPGVDSYEYCVGTIDGACDLVDWTDVGTNTSVGLSSLATDTTYYWQVRAVNLGGSTEANEGAFWSFITVPETPAAFGKSTPSNGATNLSLDPTLTWAASPGVDSYEYCLGTTDGACDLIDWTDVGTNTSVGLSSLATDTTYYWQVRAIELGGSTEANEGAFWSFTTISIGSSIEFGKTTPMNGAIDISLSPTLTWEISPGADGYEYCLGATSSSCDLVDWTNVGTNTSVILSGLEAGTTYYWSVRAVNQSGSVQADGGTWWSFSTNAESPSVNRIFLPLIVH